MPSNTNPYLRQMTAGEIFPAAFRMYRDHLSKLVLVTLVPHAVLAGLLMALPLSGQVTESEAVSILRGLIIPFIIFIVLVLAALTVTIGALVLGENPSLLEVYRRTFRAKLGSMMITSLIVNFPVNLLLLTGLQTGLRSGNLIMFFLFLAPALYLGGLLFPALAIVIVERAWFPKAVYRSISMGRRAWTRAAGVFSFFLLIWVLIPPLVLSLLMAGQSGIPGPLWPLLWGIISSVTLPLGFIAIVLFYFSMRSVDEEIRAGLLADLEGLQRGKTSSPPDNT